MPSNNPRCKKHELEVNSDELCIRTGYYSDDFVDCGVQSGQLLARTKRVDVQVRLWVTGYRKR